jgi:hypothetical protein
VSIVKARWAAKQRPGYPMPRGWSTTLALALIQALLGHRAVSQAILSKCALAKDQVATWTYSHGQAILEAAGVGAEDPGGLLAMSRGGGDRGKVHPLDGQEAISRVP